MPKRYLTLIIILILVGVISVALGSGLGKTLQPSSQPEEEKTEMGGSLKERLEGKSSDDEPKEEVKIAGQIEKKEDYYQIVDKNGQVLARLKSSAIDLGFVSGSDVVITGTVTGTEDNVKVVDVVGVQL